MAAMALRVRTVAHAETVTGTAVTRSAPSITFKKPMEALSEKTEQKIRGLREQAFRFQDKADNWRTAAEYTRATLFCIALIGNATLYLSMPSLVHAYAGTAAIGGLALALLGQVLNFHFKGKAEAADRKKATATNDLKEVVGANRVQILGSLCKKFGINVGAFSGDRRQAVEEVVSDAEAALRKNQATLRQAGTYVALGAAFAPLSASMAVLTAYAGLVNGDGSLIAFSQFYSLIAAAAVCATIILGWMHGRLFESALDSMIANAEAQLLKAEFRA